MSGGCTRAAAFLAGMIIAAGMCAAQAQTGAAIPGLPGFGGPFALVDQDGRTRTDTEFRGKLMLVTFGYTGCPDVCPLDLQKVSAALDAAGAEIAAETVPLFISIDPDQDTPERLKQFVRPFGPEIVGLTGTREEIGRVVAAYRVHAAVIHHAGHDEPDHSDFQYLMGPDGKLLSLIQPDASAADIAARLRKYAAGQFLPKEHS
jgi:protein SCO1/2